MANHDIKLKALQTSTYSTTQSWCKSNIIERCEPLFDTDHESLHQTNED
jgi:hypothetical protein